MTDKSNLPMPNEPLTMANSNEEGAKPVNSGVVEPENPVTTPLTDISETPQTLNDMPGQETQSGETVVNTEENQNKFIAPNTQEQTQNTVLPETPFSPLPTANLSATPGLNPMPPVPTDFISTTESQKGSKFKVFVIVSIIIIVIIYAVVAYLYFSNKNSKGPNSVADDQKTESLTPGVKPFQIAISNGNIVKQVAGEAESVIVSKSDYTTTGITGFVSVSVSPDKSKICFGSLPPAPSPSIFVANIDGTNVVKMADARQNCIWDKESKSVFYTDILNKTKSVNIYQYDMTTSAETDLTSGSINKGTIRQYKIVGLSADASKLICQYEDVSPSPKPSEVPSGQCQIDLSTNEVTIL